ncbi:MAG TPA: hypothetical protein VGR96_14220, partial [Acidobacteriaceae bacterium]|nr:hypothetical protein [Acidobacteriaceae bacterium]
GGARMRRPPRQRLLCMYLFVLRCASLLLREEQRGEWWKEWSGELWYVWHATQNASGNFCAQQTAVAAFCRGAFADAFWMRRGAMPLRARLLLREIRAKLGRSGLHLPEVRCNLTSPGGCLLFLAALLASSLLLALHLPDARNAILPSPYRESARTVLIARGGYSDAPFPTVRLEEFRQWRTSTHQYFTDLAFYQPVTKRVHFAPHNTAELRMARGTDNLFALLNSTLVGSRTSGVLDRGGHRELPSLILSQSTWRAHFGSDRSIVGRVVQVAGEDVVVAGIVPDTFWQLPGRMQAWIFYGDRRFESLPGNTRGIVVAHLRASAFSEGSDGSFRMSVPTDAGGYDSFECTSLAQRLQQPFSMFLFALLLAVLSLPATTSLPLGEYPVYRGSKSLPVQLRRWMFLSVKLVLLVPAVYFISLDVAQRTGNFSDLGASLYNPCLPFGIQFPVSFAGCLFAFRWALRDQRRRCPVCLRTLRNPARVGEPSRNFLAWNGTELMCEAGHGLLHVPEIATSWFSTQRWLYLDPSWKSLFPPAAVSAP